MTTEQALYAFLSGQTGITDLVSTRIYPVQLPQASDYPSIRFDAEDNGGFADFDGQGGTIESDIQIDCVASTTTAANQIAAAVTAALKNYVGAMGTRHVFRTSLRAKFVVYEDGIAGGMYRASMAWVIWHN